MAQTIFDTCIPRSDVLAGTVESDFAADLASVVRGEAKAEYNDPESFFASTYPTEGLRSLLENVCQRLSGSGSEIAAIFRLDTSYGGGKTHGLIALVHAASGQLGNASTAEFVRPSTLPKGKVRIAAFDGENADPVNGRRMLHGNDEVFAYTPWGELAFLLAGKHGYMRVRQSDQDCVAPGAETIRELFGGEPTLILLDELSVYLRKVTDISGARDQLTAFLSSLFKAVESAPNVALVYTLALDDSGRAVDAFSEENQFIADKIQEIEKVSARKATLLNPTDPGEYPMVLRRRLFESIDEDGAKEVVSSYKKIWRTNRDRLNPSANHPENVDRFLDSYPFHPDFLDTLTLKTSTLESFQRVRGMLRLLARTISNLWSMRPSDANAIHLHHVHPGVPGISQEIVTRLEQKAFVPAVLSDIAGSSKNPALSERIDANEHAGLPPYASYVSRSVFLHSLAYNEQLKGVTLEGLRYSVIGPSVDLSFIDKACTRFSQESAYLDDRPGALMRFVAEPNLTRLIQLEEQNVEASEVRTHLNDRIREVFAGRVFSVVQFPGGPFDVPDDSTDGSPKLVVLAYDGVVIDEYPSEVPQLVKEVHKFSGADGSALRVLRNNLVFVVADDGQREEMRRKSRRRLALRLLKQPERLVELAEHQQAKVRAWEEQSEAVLDIAIKKCYRHVFYPSTNQRGEDGSDLAYTLVDTPPPSERPASGQHQVERQLREIGKLRTAMDQPDQPAFVRDKTPLLSRGHMTTAKLRDEFRRDSGLPMLVGDDVFLKGIQLGLDMGVYVYKRGELVSGQGDPPVAIVIDEHSSVLTSAFAYKNRIWPREEQKPPEPVPRPEPGPGPEPYPVPPVPPSTFFAEGLLSEAFAVLWEQCRSAKVERVTGIKLHVYEPLDGLRLTNNVDAIPDTTTTVQFVGGFETQNQGEFRLEFKGPTVDAAPLREYLEPQLRSSQASDLETQFEIEFRPPFELIGDAPEKLAERLARFATSSLRVELTTDKQKTAQ